VDDVVRGVGEGDLVHRWRRQRVDRGYFRDVDPHVLVELLISNGKEMRK